MKSPVSWLIFEWRLAPVIVPVTTACMLFTAIWWSGAFHTDAIPWYYSSKREFLGTLLLFILIPSYIVLCLITGMRHTLGLAQSLDQTSNTSLENFVRVIPVRQLVAFGFIGIIYALIYNVPGYGLNFLETDIVERIAILGQVIVWTFTIMLLPVRFRIAQAFNRAGDFVEVDIFEPSNLNPFARNGLIDVLIISGAIVITTVQSLDLSFRPDNYYKAMVIALPSMIFLAILPMWRLHKRMLAIRQDQLHELNTRIRDASKAIDVDHVNRLEVLLQRRERVRQASTWPVDVTIIRRFLFYIVIPPLAWVGAALVELALDSFVG